MFRKARPFQQPLYGKYQGGEKIWVAGRPVQPGLPQARVGDSGYSASTALLRYL